MIYSLSYNRLKFVLDKMILLYYSMFAISWLKIFYMKYFFIFRDIEIHISIEHSLKRAKKKKNHKVCNNY